MGRIDHVRHAENISQPYSLYLNVLCPTSMGCSLILADCHHVLQAWLGKLSRSASCTTPVLQVQQYTYKITAECGLRSDLGLFTQQSNRSSCYV